MFARFLLFCSLLLPLFVPSVGKALPWDTDMAKQQSLKANEIARNPVKGTVPRGTSVPFTMSTSEAEKSLRNPTQTTKASLARGERLWSSNCIVCHGEKARANGTVSTWLNVPDLTTDFYRGSTDGRVFAIIYNGGAAMPRYGYKFSHAEIWDIVNYLRRLQGVR